MPKRKRSPTPDLMFLDTSEDIAEDDPELLLDPIVEPESEDYETDTLSDSDTESDTDIDDGVRYKLNPFVSRDGETEWERLYTGTLKTRQADKLAKKPGPVTYVRERVQTPLDAFNVFFTDQMRLLILNNTNLEGKRRFGDKWIVLNGTELDAYFGILILQGVFRESKRSTAEVWSRTEGRPIYNTVMPRNRFNQINSALRFDDKLTRANRTANDKMAHIREFFDHWTSGLRNAYVPHAMVTVDEQLIGFRGRCSFLQYMPSKPDSYGIKQWELVDAESTYVCNAQLYLGKPTNAPPAKHVGRNVVLSLTEYLGVDSGVNITADNFFGDCELARILLERNMTFVGTMRKNKREIPREFLPDREREQYSSHFGFTNDLTLVSYVPKKDKAVILLSSYHHSDLVSDGAEKKPEIILTYNETKAGVDTVDQLIQYYGIKRITRRWPMTVFYNIIDICGINAFVIFCEIFALPKKRREFLKSVAYAMMKGHLEKRREKNEILPRYKEIADKVIGSAADVTAVPAKIPVKSTKSLRCLTCWTGEKRRDNKTNKRCDACNLPCCFDHLFGVCPDCNG